MKRVRLRVVLVCALALAFVPPRAAAAQGAGGRVTKEEEAEAREVASAFFDRLFETHDFATVVGELYVSDYMPRYFRSLHAANERAKDSTFMLDGVPSLSFNNRLAAHADDEHWPRLFVAANNFMHYGFVSMFSRRDVEEMGDPERIADADMLAAFPPEAVGALRANPSLANFIRKEGDDVEVGTPEELRAVTEAMEEAGRLTRAGFAERVPATDKLERDLAMLRSIPAHEEVSLVADAEDFGYPEGTRLFRVFAPVCYDLILVREGGKLKIVWAFMADE